MSILHQFIVQFIEKFGRNYEICGFAFIFDRPIRIDFLSLSLFFLCLLKYYQTFQKIDVATAIIKKSKRALYYYAIYFIIGYSFSKFISKYSKLQIPFNSSHDSDVLTCVTNSHSTKTLPYYSLTVV